MRGIFNNPNFDKEGDYPIEEESSTSLVDEAIQALEEYASMTKASLDNSGLSLDAIKAVHVGVKFIKNKFHIDHAMQSMESIIDSGSLYTASLEMLVDIEQVKDTLKSVR